MSADFCHLHNHSEYSLLDGANRTGAMVQKAAEMGMDSLALTDHGVMFGSVEFYFAAKKAGIKPILGVEAYVAPKGIHSRGGRSDKDSYHLLLLAKNETGYRNLCKLSSVAALEGYYYKPRVDHEILRKFSEGVIATSACLGSEICNRLMEDNFAAALKTAELYVEIFGQDNFFIELQDHGLPEQARIKPGLLQIAKDLKLPLIATNDAHYLCKGDAKSHDVLLCIQTGSMVSDEKRMRFETEEFYLKSQEDMKALFADTPEAIENTLGIAQRCELDLESQRPPMPQPVLPKGATSMGYLRELAEKGLQNRSGEPEKSLDRLNYELGIIEKTGFADYFLLVREFAQATRDRGIYFGVRGSAAGSLVSYTLGITDVDPVAYDITFERFLNPERISMPDIDMDFEDARRDEIIDYVIDRFGSDHVAQIVTFGTLGPKAAIRDCARVTGFPLAAADKLCKLIPTVPDMTINRALDELPEFKRQVESDPQTKELVATAQSVEGMARHSGVHAAGVVITRDPLVEYVPLYRDGEGRPVTAYEMKILEKLNLLKMDFLGLSNLTVIARTVESVLKTQGITLDIRKIPLDDKKTYDMIGRGETVGVFQLEGRGMTAYIQSLKPSSITELSAMVALYRPGPLDHIPTYIDNKHGRKKPIYLDDRMKPILEDTYGVIVYQDQVLKLVQSLAGFSLGKADILRKAMGKKDRQALDSLESEFTIGCKERGLDEAKSKKVWEMLIPFAGYAFNKAHAVCYGILAYQTAYLKANFPVEYLTALLSVYIGKEDRVISCIEECSRQKISILPPDINKSQVDFAIEGHRGIRFGLTALKGVGKGVAEGIIRERAANGNFKHLFEFAIRTKEANVSKTSLEPLIKVGAFDEVDSNRNRLLAAMEGALLFAADSAKKKASGQDSLFLDGGTEDESIAFPPIQFDVPEPTRSERLAMEKEVTGLFVTDHPLRGMEQALLAVSDCTCADVSEMNEGSQVVLAGIIASRRDILTKDKKRMATAVLEDLTGQVGITVFPASYLDLKDAILSDKPLKITGSVMVRERNGDQSVEVRAMRAEILDLENDVNESVRPFVSSEGTLEIGVNRATESQLLKVKEILDGYPGDFACTLVIKGKKAYPPIVRAQGVDPVRATPELQKLTGITVCVD